MEKLGKNQSVPRGSGAKHRGRAGFATEEQNENAQTPYSVSWERRPDPSRMAPRVQFRTCTYGAWRIGFCGRIPRCRTRPLLGRAMEAMPGPCNSMC